MPTKHHGMDPADLRKIRSRVKRSSVESSIDPEPVLQETPSHTSLSIASEVVQATIQEIMPEKTQEDRGFRLGLCSGPPITNAGKRQQQVKMVFLILIPFTTLLSVALYMNTDSIFAMIQADQTKSTVEFSVYVGRLIVVLQKEQDQSVLYLSSIGPETKFFLAQTYTETDLYLEELPYWPTGLDRSDRRFFDSKNAFKNYLQQHRNELGSSNISIYDEILFYKNSIDVFLIWLYDALKESRYSSLWKTLVAYQKVIFCVHYAGIERALGTTYFVEGGFSDPYLYIKYNEVVYVFKNNFEAAMKYSPLVKPISQYNALVNGENLTSIIERYRDQIQFQNISAPSLNDAAAWFDFMSTYLDILFNFQTELAEDILQILNESITRVLTDVASSSLVICIVIIILPITLRAIYNLTNDIQSYAINLAHKTRELNMEKKRTDLLLHQMLPKAVAERLKRKKGSLAEYFKDVTVFFSEIPGFVRLSSDLEPFHIIQVLNHLYTVFDSRIEKYDVYKVETIGDSYMVASGLPHPNEHRHAIEIASMALDLRAELNRMQLDDEIEARVGRFKLRIGINSGPVIAGVVGMKLPRYCLFGDTVNTASRLESYSEPNRIHVSLSTWKLLVRYGKGFVLVSRSKGEFKGKGKMRSFWLEGKADSSGKGQYEIVHTQNDSKQQKAQYIPNIQNKDVTESPGVRSGLTGASGKPQEADPVSYPPSEGQASTMSSVATAVALDMIKPVPVPANLACHDSKALADLDGRSSGDGQRMSDSVQGDPEMEDMIVSDVNLMAPEVRKLTQVMSTEPSAGSVGVIAESINAPQSEISGLASNDDGFKEDGSDSESASPGHNIPMPPVNPAHLPSHNEPPSYEQLMAEILHQNELS